MVIVAILVVNKDTDCFGWRLACSRPRMTKQCRLLVESTTWLVYKKDMLLNRASRLASLLESLLAAPRLTGIWVSGRRGNFLPE